MGSHASRSHVFDLPALTNGQHTIEDTRAAVMLLVQELPPEEVLAVWKLMRWWYSMPRPWRTRA